MDWSRVDYLWIIVVGTFILTAPIRCRGSNYEQLKKISILAFKNVTTCPIIIFLEFYYEEKFNKIEGFTLNIWKQHAKPPVENTCVVGLLTQNLKNDISLANPLWI